MNIIYFDILYIIFNYKMDCKKILIKHKLYDKNSTRKWLKLNYNKINKTKKEKEDLYKIVECYKKSDFSNLNKETEIETPKEKNKLFKSLRRVGNFSNIKSYHKFDKTSFNKEQLLNDIIHASPKISQMMTNINILDENDKKKYGKVFKHFIFSDVKEGGYGAKIIASAFKALNYNDVIKNEKGKLKVKIDEYNNYNNYGLLCSNSIYDKIFTENVKKDLLSIYNERPSNINGEKIRFIILDSGYKEGIDLFDVKYVHIFEPANTIADLKQVIGRATRTCGQRGLDFIEDIGWPLYVYNYYLNVPNSIMETFYVKDNKIKDEESDEKLFEYEKYHDSILKLSEYDLALNNLAKQLYELAPVLSVDYVLTKNLNNADYYNNILLNADEKYKDKKGGGTMSTIENEFKKLNKKSKFYSIDLINCDGKCGKILPTTDVPVSTSFLQTVYEKYKHPKSSDKSRGYFCLYMKENGEYCKQLNTNWNKRYSYIPAIIETGNKTNIKKNLNKLDLNLDDKDKDSKSKKLYKIEEYDGNEKENLDLKKKLNFKQLRDYIKSKYDNDEYVWEKIKLENKCIDSNKDKKNNGNKIIEYNKTQKFIVDFFNPESPYKGMLLWHSVGTGKTCTAIACASSSFEKEKYSILWVTRTTLKEDIWKNMFEQVCNSIIIKQLEEGLIMPNDLTSRKKLIKNNWIDPISYKQFSNLLLNKNKALSSLLIKKNGKQDILKKTLIIIDEAHKLYSDDLSDQEKPNVDIMNKLIKNSYKISGKDSCKLLLMSATPFTDSPIDFFKLMNLFAEKKEDEITTDKKEFVNKYMTKDNIISEKGMIEIANKLSGTISFLNREKDATQFAQPILIDVPVLLTYIKDETVRDNYYNKTKKQKKGNKKVSLKEEEYILENLKKTLYQEIVISNIPNDRYSIVYKKNKNTIKRIDYNRKLYEKEQELLKKKEEKRKKLLEKKKKEQELLQKKKKEQEQYDIEIAKLIEFEKSKINEFKEKKKKEKEKQDLLKLKKFVENKVTEERIENIKNGIENKSATVMFNEIMSKYKIENGKIMKK
tara:strand:- start:6472 stop:9624 length:3153 start_codon:yes stop_codon:yes gene_type:complete